MGDAHLRALERRASQDGEEAEARLLRELLRSGALGADRLELAAALGHRAAAIALGVEVELEDPDLREWLWGFLRWGPHTVVRALVGACGRALQSAPEDAELGRLEDVLQDLEAWCNAPDEQTFDHAFTVAGDVQFDGIAGDRGWAYVLGTAVHAAVTAAWIAGKDTGKPFLYKAWEALRSLAEALTEEELRDAIRDHLLDSALGLGGRGH